MHSLLHSCSALTFHARRRRQRVKRYRLCTAVILFTAVLAICCRAEPPRVNPAITRSELADLVLPVISLREASLESALDQVSVLVNRQLSSPVTFISEVLPQELESTMITTGDQNITLSKFLGRLESFFGIRFELSGNVVKAVSRKSSPAPGETRLVREETAASPLPTEFGTVRAFVEYLNDCWVKADYGRIKEAIDLRLKETKGKDIAGLLALADYYQGFKNSNSDAKKTADRIQSVASGTNWKRTGAYNSTYRGIVKLYQQPGKASSSQWTFDWKEMRKQDASHFPSQGLLLKAGRDQYGEQ
jgi:hypothetical protein